MALPWFRLYHELLDDPKVQGLSPQNFKHWINLLCVACRYGGTFPDFDTIAFHLRLRHSVRNAYEPPIVVSEVVELMNVLWEAGLLDNADGTFTPHNWPKRQYKSDTSTERVKRYRESARKRLGAHVRNAGGNVSVTPPESDTDTESDIKKDIYTKPPKRRFSYPSDFEEFWKAYPTDALMSKKAAFGVWGKMAAEDRQAARLSVDPFKAHCRANPTYRPVHAVRYLSQERYKGFAAQNVVVETFYITSGTAQWDAWAAHYREQGRVLPSDAKGGWRVPKEWPTQQLTIPTQSDNLVHPTERGE